MPSPSLTLQGSSFLENLKGLFNRTADIDSAGRVSITPRQIYIIPTKFGLVFACMILAMLVGANNYGINLAFALTFFLTGLGLSAMLQTWRNLVHTRISPANVEPVFCGDAAIFPVHLENTRPSSRSGLQLRIDQHTSACDIPANTVRQLACHVPAEKRGYLEAGRWTLFTFFPLGMFYSWAYFHTGQKCLVYPRPADGAIPLEQLFQSRFLDLLLIDETADFRGHIKYQPGDNLKRIDWKVLARDRGKLIKDFRKPQSEDIWLRWSDVLADDVEEILSILCRAVIELEQTQIEFGMEIPGTIIDPGTGIDHKDQCLASLALFRQ